MRVTDTIRRAGQSLRQAKARTLLTSLAIAVGAFTLTAAMAVGEGARRYGEQLIGDNVNPRVLFIVADDGLFNGNARRPALREYDPDVSMTNMGASVKMLTQKDIDKLSKRSDLEKIVPVYDLSVKYMTFSGSDKKFTSEVNAYDSTIRATATAGTLPQLGAQIADDQVVVPDSFVQTLKKDHIIKNDGDLIGKTVMMTIASAPQDANRTDITAAFQRGGEAAVQELMNGKTKEIKLTVRALAGQSANAMSGSSAMQVSANTARDIAEYTTKGTSQYQKYMGVTALATEGHSPEDVKQQLKQAGYSAQTAHDLQDMLFTIVNVLQGIVTGFGILALIASVFGIINTQYISVLERTQQIGLMKALGMRGRHVQRMFLFEAAWIGLLGGVIGAGLAVIVGTALNPWVTETLKLGEGTSLLIFQPIPIAILIIGLALVAMIAGYFPSRKASKLDPIEALRTE